MNEKKAKRLRQLVRHLQERGATEQNVWLKYATYPEMGERPVINMHGKLEMAPHMIGQATLDPQCGRAIYQKMKDSADRNGKGV